MGLLRDYTEKESVNNIVLFISDALRWDELPKSISELGVTAKTIAASTSTNSSLPSLTSGRYPSNHGIWSIYDQQFSPRPELMQIENVGYNSETSWETLPSKEKPPLKVHGLTEELDITDLTPPFVYIEHDKGPHAPYDELHSDYSDEEFYQRYLDKVDTIPQMYSNLVDGSRDRFFRVYDILTERNLIDETLIVFTSDHGELLGEDKYGRLFGHGHPVVPEVVEVPTVFIGAGLKKNVRLERAISSTDLAPTMLGAQGRKPPKDVDGINLWDQFPEEGNYPRTEAKYSHYLTVYKATGVFDINGGYVYNHLSSAHSYGLWVLNQYKKSSSAIVRRKDLSINDISKTWACYRPGLLSYGNPNFNSQKAKDIVQRSNI